METILYKKNRKIICYIEKTLKNDYVVKTGKPSDISCLSWCYKNLFDAKKTAIEYFNNRTNYFNTL